MRRKGRTAAELLAELEADPDHVARQAQVEAERTEHRRSYRAAEQDLLDRLGQRGVEVETVEAIKALPNQRYERASVELLDLLNTISDRGVRDDAVRALGRPSGVSRTVVHGLIKLMRRSQESAPADDSFQWTIGDTLAAMANSSMLAEMMEVASDKGLGRARQMVVFGLGQLG